MYTFIGTIGEMELKYRRVSLSKFCIEEKRKRERERERESIFFEIFNSILSGYFHIFDIINIV